MNVSPRDRRALMLGGIGLASIVLYFGGIEPLHGAYRSVQAKHRAAALRVRQAVYDARDLDAFQSDIRAWKEKAGPLVPERTYSEQITAIGSRIIAAAGESGVQLQGATPTVPTLWVDPPELKVPGMPAADPLEQALIHIDAQAEWENIFKFVAALYRIDGVLSVEQMDLTGEGKPGPLKVRLSVSVLMRAASGDRHL